LKGRFDFESGDTVDDLIGLWSRLDYFGVVTMTVPVSSASHDLDQRATASVPLVWVPVEVWEKILLSLADRFLARAAAALWRCLEQLGATSAAFDPDQQRHGGPNANNQEVGGPDEAHMRIYVGRLRRRSGGALVCIGKH
jgi:hypothetical protein